MKTIGFLILVGFLVGVCCPGFAEAKPLRVVTTLPDYAYIARNRMRIIFDRNHRLSPWFVTPMY